MPIRRKKRRPIVLGKPVIIAASVAAIVLVAVITLIVSIASDHNAGRMESGYTAIPSPNYDKRPFWGKVDCVVLHATATDTADEAVNTFIKPSSRVSAHFIVDRSGKVIQMVPIGRRAWHAGVSRLGSQGNVNNYSIGIEIVNRNDGRQSYTVKQYKAVAEIIRHLRHTRHLTIPSDRIVSHKEIALPQGRKSDPRGFSFSRLQRIMKE